MLNEFLYNKLNNQYESFEVSKIIEGYSKIKPTTFRVNTIKTNKKYIETILKEEKINYEKVSWYEDAFVIKNQDKHKIEQLDIYKDGTIYLQSLSSMLPPLLIDVKENESILDMTASPGSKTTQLSSLYKNIKITAIEKDKIRYERLKYNIEKQGAKNVSVINTDATKLDDLLSFDKILLDAPCSGSGKIKENNKLHLSEKTLKNFTDLQEKLLRKALTILKPGKEMIYSTCSILKDENEFIINKVMKDFNISIIPLEIDKNIPVLKTSIDGTICVCPNELFEGFFIAKIKKN